jgi:tetratricopeptide (TPR) repeat protein
MMRGLGPKLILVGLASVALTLGILVRERPPLTACRSAMKDIAWSDAIAPCTAAYRKEDDSEAGLLLATAYMYLGDMDAAESIARELMTGPTRGGANRILGMAALHDYDRRLAMIRVTTALAIDAASGDRSEMMRDASALSSVFWKEGAHDAALAAADVTRGLAMLVGDRRALGFAEMIRGDIFCTIGDDVAAGHALAAAETQLTAPCDRSWWYLKQGVAYRHAGQRQLAEEILTRALAAAVTCKQRHVVVAASLNLAWLVRPRGWDAAMTYLANTSDVDSLAVRVLHGLIDADGGDYVAADARLASALTIATHDSEWPWLITMLRAEVAEVAARTTDAEALYRQAIALGVELRGRTTASSPYLLASHRSAYEGLIGLLAGAGRWADVLEVVVALDAHDLLRTTSAAGGIGPDGVERAQNVRLAPIELSPSSDVVSAADVLAAWRGRDLVILVGRGPRAVKPGGERVWRLHVRDGVITGEDVGDAAAAALLADDVLADPFDVAKGNALGAMMVPADASTVSLFVLAVGALGRAPLAALRRGGALVLAQRPLVRVLGIRPRRAAAPVRSGAAVFGDPRLDLKEAEGEAREVAKVLGVDAMIGPNATVAALLAAGRVADLHIAAHSDDRGRRIVLHLADGDVGADDIARTGLAPGHVFLASCGSAAAGDEESWGSLAAAFLANGTERVVATQWSIRDKRTPALVATFYDQYRRAGLTDPERALAAAQVMLAAKATNSDWASFTVLASPPPAAR